MLADHRFRGDHKYIGRMIPLRFIPQLDLVLDGRVIALDGHIRNAQLEIVLRPILQFGHSIGSLVVHRKVGEQHAGRVRSDEDEHVPEGMHVRKVNAPPGVAEELVRYPAAEGQHEDEAAADAQAVDARTAFTVYTNEFRKIVGKIKKNIFLHSQFCVQQRNRRNHKQHKYKGVYGWFPASQRSGD